MKPILYAEDYVKLVPNQPLTRILPRRCPGDDNEKAREGSQ